MNDKFETQVAYIHGRVEAQIEAFAVALGVPARLLAKRLGSLLLGQASGKPMGAVDRVPSVSGATKERQTLAAVEMAERPHSKTHRKMSAQARKNMSAGQRKRWTRKKAA